MPLWESSGRPTPIFAGWQSVRRFLVDHLQRVILRWLCRSWFIQAIKKNCKMHMIKVFLTLLLWICFLPVGSAQDNKGWHLLDKTTDGYYGISLERAKRFVATTRTKARPLIVAVIDSGVDTTHAALKPSLWVNEKEIPGNNIDDDGDGYVDDVNGWNFLGGKDGTNVIQDSDEQSRVYFAYRDRFMKDTVHLNETQQRRFEVYKKAAAGRTLTAVNTVWLSNMRATVTKMQAADSILHGSLPDTYTGHTLDSLQVTDTARLALKTFMLKLLEINHQMESPVKGFIKGFSDYVHSKEMERDMQNTAPVPYRTNATRDDETNIDDRNYGNGILYTENALHGTHVVGIIHAIAPEAKIMMLRAVPDGDEHDKDIALAIRYAVDHGARIINMSFGKGLSPDKPWVDDAVKYAEKHDVLLIHAAGNDNKNIDSAWNFPNGSYLSGTKAKSWLTVGASGDVKLGGIRAGFSNYGKETVDVFAPGVEIWSTIPGNNRYAPLQGTSMAAPVVTGVAAFVLTYYPKLKAAKLKRLIEESVAMPEGELQPYSRTGGIVNLYQAVKRASEK